VNPGTPPPEWRPADPEALQAAIEGAGGGGSLPGPSLAEYGFDLARWLEERFFDFLGRTLPATQLPVLEVVVWTAAGAATVALLVLFAMASRRRRRRAEVGPAVTALDGAATPAPSGDAAWWWAEAGRLLDRGEVRPALAALWWWAARRLDPPGLDPAWTTADLLRVGGSAARAPLRRVERLLWGPGAPAREDAEAVRGELAQRLGAGGQGESA
jgi:hypothetical protein